MINFLEIFNDLTRLASQWISQSPSIRQRVDPNGTVQAVRTHIYIYIYIPHERYGIADHRQLNYLFNSLFCFANNKNHQISALLALCEWNQSRFPSQRLQWYWNRFRMMTTTSKYVVPTIIMVGASSIIWEEIGTHSSPSHYQYH